MNPLLYLAFGFALCLGISLGAISIARPLGLLDIPEGRHQHKHPTARVGGLGLVLAALLFNLAGGHFATLSRIEYFAVLGMACLGFLDDRFDLRARWKAALGLSLAFVLAYLAADQVVLAGKGIQLLGFWIKPVFLPLFFLLTAMYWALPHAYNLIDGANGLAIGFGLIVLGSLWLAGYPHYFLCGAMLACLCLNWPKARLFLGDTGSLSIGLLLVLLVYNTLAPRGANHVLWVFAYPTVDVTTVVLIRLLQGRSVGLGDRSHLHFQLLDRWPSTASWRVPFLWAMAAMCASEVYLNGLWLVIPWLGLSLLVGQALLLGLLSVKPFLLYEHFHITLGRDLPGDVDPKTTEGCPGGGSQAGDASAIQVGQPLCPGATCLGPGLSKEEILK